MTRVELGGTYDPNAALDEEGIFEADGNELRPEPIVIILQTGVFKKKPYYLRGYTHFEVWCVGAAGQPISVLTAYPPGNYGPSGPGGGNGQRKRGRLRDLDDSVPVVVGSTGAGAPFRVSQFDGARCQAAGGVDAAPTLHFESDVPGDEYDVYLAGHPDGYTLSYPVGQPDAIVYSPGAFGYNSQGDVPHPGMKYFGDLFGGYIGPYRQVSYPNRNGTNGTWDGVNGTGGTGGAGGTDDPAESAIQTAGYGGLGAHNPGDGIATGPGGDADGLYGGPGGGIHIPILGTEYDDDHVYGSWRPGCHPGGAVVIKLWHLGPNEIFTPDPTYTPTPPDILYGV